MNLYTSMIAAHSGEKPQAEAGRRHHQPPPWLWEKLTRGHVIGPGTAHTRDPEGEESGSGCLMEDIVSHKLPSDYGSQSTSRPTRSVITKLAGSPSTHSVKHKERSAARSRGGSKHEDQEIAALTLKVSLAGVGEDWVSTCRWEPDPFKID